jgi:predicted lipoprotein with Yx(FWY)xxD motif
MRRWLIVLALLAAACGGSADPSAPTSTPTPLSETAVSLSSRGELRGYGDQTLYLFANDSVGVSNCVNQCLFDWPPLLVADAASIPLDDGLDPQDFGTLVRDDGALQVTFRGLPLYFHQVDVKPGDALGDGIDGLWTVATYSR